MKNIVYIVTVFRKGENKSKRKRKKQAQEKKARMMKLVNEHRYLSYMQDIAERVTPMLDKHGLHHDAPKQRPGICIHLGIKGFVENKIFDTASVVLYFEQYQNDVEEDTDDAEHRLEIMLVKEGKFAVGRDVIHAVNAEGLMEELEELILLASSA